MNNPVLYVNAAKGIQDFILKTDKLKEMIGGSEIIEQLPIRLLPDVLEALKLKEDTDYHFIVKAAGGSSILFNNEENAPRLAEIWPLLCDIYAPGLQMVQAVAPITDNNLADALNAAEKNLRTSRNLLSTDLPQAGPLARRCYRTGLAASEIRHEQPVDPLTARKLAVYNSAGIGLLEKIYPDPETRAASGIKQIDKHEWLFDLNDIGGEGSYLALIHADANGLGGVRMQFCNQLANQPLSDGIKHLRAFSTAVETATIKALREALAPILKRAQEAAGRDGGSPLYPVRPIVCAGDDLTIIMEAGQALTFTRNYLRAFERESETIFDNQEFDGLLRKGLTACAGITYMKRKFPFSMAYELCESLCSFSKKAVNRKASALSFFRITTSSVQDYLYIYEHDLTVADTILTMAPYRLHGNGGATVDNLLALAEVMRLLPKGSFRNLVSCLMEGRNAALPAFRRLCDVTTAAKREALKQALEKFTANAAEHIYKHSTTKTESPIFDALEVLRVHDFS